MKSGDVIKNASPDFEEINVYYKRKSDVIFRNYETFGYITDNRNFGYRLGNKNENNIGDKILSESGAVFLSVLDKTPKSFDELTIKINEIYTDIDISTIKKDVKEFFCMLEHEGFLVSGDTKIECEEKDKKFSYNNLDHFNVGNNSPNNNDLDNPTRDFFEEYFKGKSQLTNLHIEITSKCNERCVHCYIPHENKIDEIEAGLFYEVLEECKNMKLLHLTLSGGEPFLHKNFCDFLNKCNEYNFSVNVLSNLTLLNDKILNEMKANSLLCVQVSLYSMKPNIHDEITQISGSFEKTFNSILKLIENDIPIKISCPILKQNKDSYSEVHEWANQYGIHVGSDFEIIGSYNHSDKNLDCRLSINEVMEIIISMASDDPLYMKQMEIEAERKKSFTEDDIICSICHSSICISENGNVYPCVGWQDNTLGNVKKTSLQTIWDDSEKIKYLRNIRRKDFPTCIQCPEKNFCTICMARNANEDPNGNPLSINKYFCKIAKLNKFMFTEWNKKQGTHNIV